MEMLNNIYKYWFYGLNGLSFAAKKRLLEISEDFKELFMCNENCFRNMLTDKQLEYFVRERNIDRIKNELDYMINNNISYICHCDENYPIKLKNIYNPPGIIYIKGNLNPKLCVYNSSIAVVGSRQTAVYGREIARYFSYKLASEGICIISGLARGIDAYAHRGALEADGYTVGVLGCGINNIYPRENIELYREIEYKGAVISEYGPGVPPLPENFPQRNRIISALSDGVLVVEAAKKSGSLITADFALEQGKQVYAVPGRILDKNSEGTNNLIKQGAVCVTDYKDIIKDMCGIRNLDNISGEQLEIVFSDDNDNESVADIKNALAPAEKLVYSCLSLDPVYIDDIITCTGLEISNAISVLYTLEERKIIRQPVKGYYIIAL